MIIHSKGSTKEMTLSSPIYRHYQSKNASEKTPFYEQDMPESPQEQSTDTSNRYKQKSSKPIPFQFYCKLQK